MNNEQFYPTPSNLAYKAYNKFKSKSIVRLLEPSAGTGSLIEPFVNGRNLRHENIDTIEIDLDKQSILRGKGYCVVDADFLASDLQAFYSHVVLNPPFSKGAEHVLKAWSVLADGELVAIINAETIRNPYTANRKLLVKIIEDHGDVEYIEQAFTDPDTLRKTNVEIALIHLEKKVDLKHNFTHGLAVDKTDSLAYAGKQELAIKSSTISNAIAVFNAAVSALKSAEVAKEESNYYTALLGKPLNQQTEDKTINPGDLQERFNKGYVDLKKRAWSNVLDSTEFSKYLSSKAYQKLVADFDAVSKLSFTESNIRGFLLGLVQGQGDMNMQMLLDCFDEITKYRPENRAYYRGWKSNEKHREQAYRVQMTRFIIPNGGYNFSNSISSETLGKLKDFDKVFYMLEGKSLPGNEIVDGNIIYGNTLYNLFDKKLDLLKSGKRMSTEYFDVRYYPGIRSIHFFPICKRVIERLNLLVGRERQWIPSQDKETTEFKNQYDQAEKVTKEMTVKVTKWGRIEDDDEKLIEAHTKACDKLGINLGNMLTN